MIKLSIRQTITLLMVVPLVVTSSLVGWLTYSSGQNSVKELERNLSQKTLGSIEQHLRTYLSQPHQIHLQNRIVYDHAQELNQFNGKTSQYFNELQHYFWDQLTELDQHTSFFYGNQEGDFIVVERLPDGTGRLGLRTKDSAPLRRNYSLDRNGNKITLLQEFEYDPRQRAWYKAAVARKDASWSPVYIFALSGELGISPAMPLYDAKKNLVGVLGIDVFLSSVSDFLNKLEISPHGRAFILERSGNLVASSVKEKPYREVAGDKQRLAALDSEDPLISTTTQEILTRFGSLDTIKQSELFFYNFQNLGGDLQARPLMGSQIVQIAPLKDSRGLDWLMVVVIPEVDFMGPIYRNSMVSLGVGVGVTFVAGMIGLLLSRWITEPVRQLSRGAQDITEGNFQAEQLTSITQRHDEFGELATVFREMGILITAREQRLSEQMAALNQKLDESQQMLEEKEDHQLEKLRNLQQRAKTIRESGRRLS